MCTYNNSIIISVTKYIPTVIFTNNKKINCIIQRSGGHYKVLNKLQLNKYMDQNDIYIYK